MRYLPVLCLIFATVAWGQDEPLPPSNVPPEYRPPILRDDNEAMPASASSIAADAAVITIKGLCSSAETSNKSTCQTVITREQFENLTEALLANMKASRKRQVAYAYPNLLAMAHEAEARGLENSPHFQERLAFAQLQLLSQELVRQIEEQAAAVSQKDIEAYYRDHAAEFETATLERIFIPNRKRMDPLPKEKATPGALDTQRKESEEAMTRLAENLRARAAAGESFLTLQKEAYAAAGMTDVPPNPSLGQVRVGGLPPSHASVFNLNSGEVSEVLNDSTGHYVYKLDAKQTEPLEAASDQILKTIANQRREAAIQAVQQPVSADFNPAYFGPMEKHAAPGNKPN